MKMFRQVTKGLVGIALIILLVLNVQIGNGNSFPKLEKGKVSVKKANAAYCEPVRQICTFDINWRIIYGDFKSGKPPKKKLAQE